MSFSEGTQVSPVVRLVRPLGRGGMGSVWVAHHVALKTDVVVKFMADALKSDPLNLARFSREAAAAAAVKSPHVVQMLDHGFMTDGTPYIVMELLDGEDLRQRLVRDGKIALPELAVIVSQACKALARAHASGIVHRDIKPDNLFLCHTDDGEPFVKLLDFGVAKLGAQGEFQMTRSGVVLGTPYYMSPEQAVGSPPLDSRTDLWSLGVVAFEAMTGVRPFDGPTLGALTMAICNERPPVPSSVDATLPAAVDAWLARACARDLDARFANAREMGEAILTAVRAPPAASRPGLPFEATSPSERVTDRLPPRAEASAPPAPRVPPRDEAPSLPLPRFTTTTNGPLSRTLEAPANTPVAGRSAEAPAQHPVAGNGRGALLGALLVAAGLAVGLAVARRDPPSASSVAVASSSGTIVREVPSPRPAAPAGSWLVVAPEGPPVEPPRAPPGTPPAGTPLPGTPLPGTGRDPAPGPPRPARPAANPGLPAASTPAAVPDCSPPYYFDAAHNKVFKKECI